MPKYSALLLTHVLTIYIDCLSGEVAGRGEFKDEGYDYCNIPKALQGNEVRFYLVVVQQRKAFSEAMMVSESEAYSRAECARSPPRIPVRGERLSSAPTKRMP
jgi:hypothetical protein